MLSAKAMVSAAASAAATVLLIKSIAKDYVPPDITYYIISKVRNFLYSLSSEMTFVIQEYDNLNQNHIFKAAELYLEHKIPNNIERLKLFMPKKQNKITASLLKGQEIVDTFNGVTLKWKLVSKTIPTMQIRTENTRYYLRDYDLKFFELRFHKKSKNIVLDTYIKHVVEKAKELSAKKKPLKLFTLRLDRRMSGSRYDMWQSVNLDHPATFDSLAMETEVKRVVMEDLDMFVKRNEFYKRVGKAWKRGYFLFGPPGTGKSSLIAAIANYLHFDIYDLELTEVMSNCELRKLMISTANRSILVLEDIDCSIQFQDRLARRAKTNPREIPSLNQRNQVTLSGFLNFMDGLWSSCGDERIIIFTTNHREKIDPALLRPGRMDVHVHMSYCTPCGFKLLASNYIGITEHSLFSEVEQLIKVTKVTPAEVGEQLMRSEEPEIALRGLIEFLQSKKPE